MNPQLVVECERHPRICEVSYATDNSGYEPEIFAFRQDVEASELIIGSNLSRYVWSTNPLLAHSLNDSPFVQQQPLAFNRAYQQGEMISKEFMAIGAADGTLTFLRLNYTTNRLAVHSTMTGVHQGSINVIWCQYSVSESLRFAFIASSVRKFLKSQSLGLTVCCRRME